MKQEEILKELENFVKLRISGYDSGHDWWHIERVRRLARHINESEKLADPFLVDIAAVLHDAVDSKFAGDNPGDGYQHANDLLDKAGLQDIAGRILDIIKNVSFSNKQKTGDLHDPVLLIIQDADKLDAMGAVGIARAFTYGGFRNNLIFSPDETLNHGSTISHFYEKLLLLKSMMNTTTGRELAAERHLFMETFLKQFYREVRF